MSGGFIYEKTIQPEFQAGTDKSLLIEPNYAYQVPFTFGSDWEEIKIGMFVSYTLVGSGNENTGFSATTTIDAGGTTNDTFNYIGIINAGDADSLPLSINNSGFIGAQSHQLYSILSSTRSYNKLSSSLYGTATAGKSNFFSTYADQTLEQKEFNADQGNFNIISYNAIPSTQYAVTNSNIYFCSYWGLNYKVINKSQSNQLISFNASQYGSSLNSPYANKIEDPSMDNLKNITNGGGGEVVKTDLHSDPTTGFLWNQGGEALTLPDSLFFYNAFPQVRPRIHAWAVKKIS